jgi:hypothetical protein
MHPAKVKMSDKGGALRQGLVRPATTGNFGFRVENKSPKPAGLGRGEKFRL